METDAERSTQMQWGGEVEIKFNLIYFCTTVQQITNICKLTLELTRPPPEKYEEEEGFHRISSTAA